MSKWNAPIPDIDQCGYPRISTAPTEVQHWSDAAILREQKKLYASQDTQTGQIFLIQNPAVWITREMAPGQRVRMRPKPIPIEQAPHGAVQVPAFKNVAGFNEF